MTAARRLLACALLFLASGSLWGQETRATLLGSVKDSSGAVMPGVAIEIVHRDNGVVTQAVTNAKGYFELAYLLPGTYDLAAKLEGFKQFKRTGITLTVNARSRIDIEMAVGGLTDTVVVSGDAPLLETSTGSGSQTLSPQQVESLPGFGDNSQNLARHAPGVQWLGQPNYVALHSNLGASQVSAAGGVGGVEYALDGVPNLARVRRIAYIPSTDTIQEIRVDTAPFDASKGHTSGATVSMLTKSGTNELHGSLSWAHWQQRWNGTPSPTNASYWGAIRAAEAKGDTALASQLRSKERQPSGHSNDYSATLGGPVKRSKLFAFLTFNGYQKSGPEESNFYNRTVPSEAHRRGDFSDLLKLGTQYQIYDPRTARLVGNSVVRDPFPNNQVPILNPIYQQYASLYPLPNNPPGIVSADGGNNYLASATPWNWRYAAGSMRMDWMPSQRHRLFGKFSWNDFVEDRRDWTYEVTQGLNSDALNRNNIAGTLDWVFSINASTVLNVSAAYNRYREGNTFTAKQTSYSPSAVGLPGYMDEKAGPFNALPRVNFSAYTSIFDKSYPATTWYNTAVVRADLTKVVGTHSVRSGLDFRQYTRASYNPGNSSGYFEFRNNFVRQTDTTSTAATRGLEWAAFMLGVPSVVSVDTNDSYYLTNPTFSAFVQDDWRVSSKLTLNLGVRFEVESGFLERYDRALGQFDGTAALPITNGAQAAYQSLLPKLTAAQARNLPASISVVGGARYLGTEGQPRTLNDAQSGIMPRLGLAYQLTRKTVLRAGYGLFYDTNNILNEDVLNQTGYSLPTSTTITNDRGLTFVNADLKNGRTLLHDPFPVRADGTRFNAPLGNDLGLMQVVGGAYDFVGRDWKRARQHRFRASLQQQLTSNTVFEVVYLGSRSDNISLTQRINPLPEQFWASGNVRNDAIATDLNTPIANPFALANFASLQSTNPTLYNDMANRGFYTATTVRKHQLLRAYPQMNGNLRNTRVPLGEAKYDHIELTLQKRFASGASFVLSYVRAWDQRRDWLADEFDTEPRWQASGFSAPHHFMANAVVELPFGKGKRFFKSGVLGAILGGWRLGSVYHFQNDTPFSFGNLFWYGDTPKDPLDPNDPVYKVIKSDNPTRERAFNLEPFLLPAARAQNPDWATNAASFAKVVSATNAARPADFHRRVFPQTFDFLRGKGMNQADLNVTRAFSFGATRRFELRADVINLLNTPQWRANPDTSPYSLSFGQLNTQWNTPRWITLKARVVF